jgi:hypothetical protein
MRRSLTPEFKASQKSLKELVILRWLLRERVLGLIYSFSFWLLVVRFITALRVGRFLLPRRILVERFELDIVLMEQVLVLAETFQQLPLGKPASSPATWGQRRRHTLHAGRFAIYTRKSAVTLDLTLLTAYTRQHPLRLRRLRGRGQRRRRRKHV